MNDLNLFLQTLDCKFDIIALSETWLKETNEDIYNLENYNHERKYRKNREEGWVSLFLDTNIH